MYCLIFEYEWSKLRNYLDSVIFIYFSLLLQAIFAGFHECTEALLVCITCTACTLLCESVYEQKRSTVQLLVKNFSTVQCRSATYGNTTVAYLYFGIGCLPRKGDVPAVY